MKKVYIYKRFNRFWHWTQAALIFFLAFTGFEVHSSFELFGYESAVRFHRTGSYALLALIAFAVFWHFTTGEWKHYIPNFKDLKHQIRYYTHGIFKNEPHPHQKSHLSKLNPLQAFVYLSFKLILVPMMVISGLFYMYHKTINANNEIIIRDMNLGNIANWHTFGAFLLIAFIIVHVYMTTTGNTPTSNIKAMITGYEEFEEDESKESTN
ncbi:MAG: cytochrome b/b6 domain-containing protein [Bacteroidales bacterium]|nr:cytochrome b/b6 domain-containing protein [Bacteroidales bacterium]